MPIGLIVKNFRFGNPPVQPPAQQVTATVPLVGVEMKAETGEPPKVERKTLHLKPKAK